MPKAYKIYVVLILLAAIFLIIAISNKYNTTFNHNFQQQSYLYNGLKNIECLYYNTTDFLNIKDFEIKQDVGTIHGCIVPHHLVAKDLIHEAFQNIIKDKKYKTVVLIGPDHESINMGKIFTTLKNWQTPMGILETENKITKELLKDGLIIENDDKLTVEHSTSSIIPFIKYYLEDVKVITLVLTKQVKLQDADKLVEELIKNLNIDETLFIASVDFSHYLELEKANEMDFVTVEAIKNKDINDIYNFPNDNLDSPISLITLLNIMEKSGVRKETLLNHSNSELILGKYLEETTSYITYLFYN